MNDDTTLRIERVIDAPPPAVFHAWTTAEAMEEWYRERSDDVVRVVELDVRVGGRYRVEFGPPGAPPYVETGVYLELDPPRRLRVSENLATPDGTAWANTNVTVVFEEEDGKTRLILVHEGFPSSEQRDNASGGWPGFIDRVERLVTVARG
jgi:glutathione S-transferase